MKQIVGIIINKHVYILQKFALVHSLSRTVHNSWSLKQRSNQHENNTRSMISRFLQF